MLQKKRKEKAHVDKCREYFRARLCLICDVFFLSYVHTELAS